MKSASSSPVSLNVLPKSLRLSACPATFALKRAAVARSIALVLLGAFWRNNCAPSASGSPLSGINCSPDQPNSVREVTSKVAREPANCCLNRAANRSASPSPASTAAISVSALSRIISVRCCSKRDSTSRSRSAGSLVSVGIYRKRASSATSNSRRGKLSNEVAHTPPGQAQPNRSATSRANTVLPWPPTP